MCLEEVCTSADADILEKGVHGHSETLSGLASEIGMEGVGASRERRVVPSCITGGSQTPSQEATGPSPLIWAVKHR